jgi:hypothetical protein
VADKNTDPEKLIASLLEGRSRREVMTISASSIMIRSAPRPVRTPPTLQGTCDQARLRGSMKKKGGTAAM